MLDGLFVGAFRIFNFSQSWALQQCAGPLVRSRKLTRVLVQIPARNRQCQHHRCSQSRLPSHRKRSPILKSLPCRISLLLASALIQRGFDAGPELRTIRLIPHLFCGNAQVLPDMQFLTTLLASRSMQLQRCPFLWRSVEKNSVPFLTSDVHRPTSLTLLGGSSMPRKFFFA